MFILGVMIYVLIVAKCKESGEESSKISISSSRSSSSFSDHYEEELDIKVNEIEVIADVENEDIEREALSLEVMRALEQSIEELESRVAASSVRDDLSVINELE